MKFKKSRFIVSAISVLTAASFVGLISGTLAWYANVTRVTVSYTGTSIAQAEQLQIGLVSDTDFTVDGENNDLGFNLTKETISGQDYYWAKPGSGFNSDAISAYLSHTGYATNEVAPVTSFEYDNGDDLSLYRAPIAGHANDMTSALHSAYVYLPFAFRVITFTNTGDIEYAKNQNVWVTDAVAQASSSSDGDIYKALRVHFDDGTTKFILNPSSTSPTASSTKVAGILDLNKDGYYDYTGSHEEILYGHYSGTLTPEAFASDSALDDVNDTGQTNPTTFTAKHKGGNAGYSDLTGLNPLLANYETLESIAPADDGTGALSGGTPICVTANDTNALAHVNLTVYMEGWDHSVIDTEINHAFNLGLQFQINRL